MARKRQESYYNELKERIVKVSARHFFEKGYLNTPIKLITEGAGIGTGSFNNIFQTKEDILCEIVPIVMEKQFAVTRELLADKTEDKLLFFATETVLQLHIAELNENVRDVYTAMYSFLKPQAIIQKRITGRWEAIFKDYLPDYTTSDFYQLEIATGGIIRGFMTVPCDMWFLMDKKVESFLECALKLYDIPKGEIREAIAFVKEIDFSAVAAQTVAELIDSFAITS